uniref:Tc1-like transposase DDE domain-containing protein n=1 Tax=Acrobeloides nanus TaxID=290746 RepID=A0A914E349_9BILA
MALDHYEADTEGNWNDWTFQQDSAPSHASVNYNKKFKVPTQTWLKDHFSDFIKKDEWPASSPDLNPLDYSIWSLLEADVNAEEHNSVESLKNAISEAFERLPMEVINQAVDNWMKRLDAVIKAKGGHFE